jgi:hypothetical protein
MFALEHLPCLVITGTDTVCHTGVVQPLSRSTQAASWHASSSEGVMLPVRTMPAQLSSTRLCPHAVRAALASSHCHAGQAPTGILVKSMRKSNE